MNEQERLQTILKDVNLNARDFAAEVGISAATMSNILNGRNKPSLEVLQKVLARYRNISTEWLILGVGAMYNGKFDSQTDNLVNSIDSDTSQEDKFQLPLQTKSPARSSKAETSTTIPMVAPDKKITRILVFYSDGTFEELSK